MVNNELGNLSVNELSEFAADAYEHVEPLTDSLSEYEAVPEVIATDESMKNRSIIHGTVRRVAAVTLAASAAVFSIGGGESAAADKKASSEPTAQAANTNSLTSRDVKIPKGDSKSKIESKVSIATFFWQSQVNQDWINGNKDLGINFPEGNPLINSPKGIAFSNAVKNSWLNRYETLRNKSNGPEVSTNVQLLSEAKLFFEIDGQVIETENAVIYGAHTDGQFGNIANRTDVPYNNFVIMFPLASGEWVATTLQQNGTGWQTHPGLKLVGLLLPNGTPPQIVDGQIDSSVPTTPTSFGLQSAEGEKLSVAPAKSYKNIRAALRPNVKGNAWEAASLWTLPGTIAK